MNKVELSPEEYFEQRVHYFNSPEGALKGRIFKFLQESNFTDRKVEFTVAEGAALGAVVGGCAGAMVGVPLGGPIGAAVGIPVGAVMGAAIGASMVEARKMQLVFPEYNAYRATEEGKEFGRELIELVKNAPQLEHLLCQISYKPLIDGVYVKGYRNNFYERSEIEKWIAKSGKDPITQNEITKDDLISEEQATYESTVAGVKFLKKKQAELRTKSPLLSRGFDALIMDYRNGFIIKHQEGKDRIIRDYQEKKISYERYIELSAYLSQRYDCL